jgi:tRNA threonylcarbamoyladenosine biosynthesis protein TsaB
MLTVAVETSTALGSVALYSEKKLLGEKSWQRSASHSELLTDSFQILLSETRKKVQEISHVAVGIGPGSFTGVRVAVNFARALAFSQNLPVRTLNSLSLLAHQPSLDEYSGVINVVQYAFRDIVYFASYKHDFGLGGDTLVELSPPEAHTVESLEKKITEPALLLGDGLEKLGEFFSTRLKSLCLRDKIYRDGPMAADFVSILTTELPDPLTDWIHTIPLYIRASEAEEKLKRGPKKSSR